MFVVYGSWVVFLFVFLSGLHSVALAGFLRLCLLVWLFGCWGHGGVVLPCFCVLCACAACVLRGVVRWLDGWLCLCVFSFVWVLVLFVNLCLVLVVRVIMFCCIVLCFVVLCCAAL